MPVNTEKLKNITIAYIGGGSLHWAYDLMHDLALDGDIEGTVRLYDIDIPAAQQNEIYGNRLAQHQKAASRWKYTVSNTLKEALAGADFVIISIFPGTFEDMRVEVHMPEEYGILQPVGDTVGPGGLFRALRLIPVFCEFARAIEEFAPDAWVINYTNPMSLCVATLYSEYPGIKAFGCCHEVFGTQKLLAAMVEEVFEEKYVQRDEIVINVLGLNHFTWLTRAFYKTEDLFPGFLKFADTYYTEGFEKLESWQKNVFQCAHRVKFDLFRRFGCIAAAGDRHLAEFIPEKYVQDKFSVAQWKFHLTTIEDRIIRRNNRIKEVAAHLSGEKPVVLEQSEEEGVRIMKALLGLGNFVTNANLPNMGQIHNCGQHAIVETNVLFMKDSACPVIAGKIPGPLEETINGHIANQQLILKAALKKDQELAFQAFRNDPLVTCDDNDAEELFFKMLSGLAHCLPGWKIPQKK
ncbi:MAG: alpha-glucosidase/alpha-galactosidase [Spirochaetales bacterium]|nr:alpha-glucosidase/alpha-galactosidase [Spirochaetales bacterium]